MRNSSVLFVGATGTSGRFVAQSLANSTLKVKALVRNEGLAKTILPSEIELIQGDVLKPHTLSEAFRGSQGLYISLGFDIMQKNCRHPYLDGFRNLLTLANLHRIEHIQAHFMWASRHPVKHWDGFELQQQAAEMLRQQSIPTTLYFCSPFIENLAVRFKKDAGVQLPVHQEKNLHWSSARLTGELAAKAFFDSRFFDKRFAVQSPDILTLKELAKRFLACQQEDSRPLVQSRSSVLPVWIRNLLGQNDQTEQWLEALESNVERYESDPTWKDFQLASPTLNCMIKKATQTSESRQLV